MDIKQVIIKSLWIPAIVLSASTANANTNQTNPDYEYCVNESVKAFGMESRNKPVELQLNIIKQRLVDAGVRARITGLPRTIDSMAEHIYVDCMIKTSPYYNYY